MKQREGNKDLIKGDFVTPFMLNPYTVQSGNIMDMVH